MATSQWQRIVISTLIALVAGAAQAGCSDDPAQQPATSPPPSTIGPGS